VSLLHAALLASVAGLAAIVIFGAWRARQLLRWLRAGADGPPPGGAGFWGEIGYRIDRLLRRRAQEALAERTRLAQFVSAMEASPNGVLLLDADDRIEWCNVRAADHFGIDPERDRGQPVTNLVRSPVFVAHLDGGDFAQPVRLQPPHGPGSIQIVVRRFGPGSKLVLSQDLTEQERADAMRRDFVANVSHEIRTPLTVRAGFIETLRDLPLDAAERQRILGLMAQQADRMLTLVSDLLTLAQLEGSGRAAADGWIRLSSVLGEIHAEADALSAGRHRLTFAAVDGVEIAAVRGELHSAISNLVSNAIRHTPEHGSVEVAWRMREDHRGELSVTDTGGGISREHLARLTERFYRVDESRSRASGGTGLGLAIVKHVVQRHGGELDVSSEPGRGSVFRLLLPASRVRVGGAP
jgi:two-component system phosphate regulon sensor histidine kinase PhoR